MKMQTSKPLHLTELNVHAENIRNVRSAPSQYPSHLQIETVVFDKGRFHLDGHADFFAEPFLAVNADVALTDITLGDLLPLTAQHQVHLSQGVLSAEGHVEYAPTVQQVRLTTLNLRDVKGDFVHAAKTQQKENRHGQKGRPGGRRKPPTIPRFCCESIEGRLKRASSDWSIRRRPSLPGVHD